MAVSTCYDDDVSYVVYKKKWSEALLKGWVVVEKIICKISSVERGENG